MGVKTTVTLTMSDALDNIGDYLWDKMKEIQDRDDFLEEAGKLYDFLYDFRLKAMEGELTCKAVEDMLEDVRDIHNVDSPYYFENYSVVEDVVQP